MPTDLILLIFIFLSVPSTYSGTVIDWSSTIVANAGDHAQLRCSNSTDIAQAKWLFNGEPVDLSNDRYNAHQSALKIRNAVGMDTGEYTCIEEGKVNQTTKLVVRDVPAPVQNVSVQCENGSVIAIVTFQYIEMYPDDPANQFWVQYNADENEMSHWETHPVSTSHLKNDTGTIRVALHPYGNFAFRVIAKNGVGQSVPAFGDQRCRTNPARPYRNPSKVVVRGTTQKDVRISWQPMRRQEWNGANFQYIVLCKPTYKENDTYQEIVVSNQMQNHIVIPSDEPYKSFDVMVKARNSEGDSVAQPAVYKGYSGEEKPPKAPTGFTFVAPSPGKPTVTFIWDPFNASDFKGVLKGFKIQHWHKTSKPTEQQYKEAHFDPSATRGTVYGLKPYSENYARILAYSGGGDGPASEVKIFNTLEGLPAPVRDLEAFALSHSDIGVIWQPPIEINGIARGYNVTWCSVTVFGKSYQIDITTCNSSLANSTRHYRISGLVPSSTYWVQVACVTGAGIGEPKSVNALTSPLIAATGPLEKPAIRVIGVGEDHINVTWLPGRFNPTDPKPLGDDYYVEYRKQGDLVWKKVPHEGDAFTTDVIGLRPGTDYQVRTVSVVHVNGTASETCSNVVMVKTSREGAGKSSVKVAIKSKQLNVRNHVLGG